MTQWRDWEDSSGLYVPFLGTTENSPGAPAYDDGFPTMAFGSGVLYAVWNKGPGGIVLRRSFDAGVTWTWTTPLNAPPPGQWASSNVLPPRIAAAGGPLR